MWNSSIWPTDRTLSGASTPGQSEPGCNGNKGVLHIPQSSRTVASSSDCLVSYTGYSLGDSYLTVYFTAPPPANWAKGVLDITLNCIWWWGSSSDDLEIENYSFIAMFFLTWTGSTF